MCVREYYLDHYWALVLSEVKKKKEIKYFLRKCFLHLLSRSVTQWIPNRCVIVFVLFYFDK